MKTDFYLKNKNKKVSWRKNQWKWVVLFLIPGMALYCSLVIYPVIEAFRLSLFHWYGGEEKLFVGLNNFRTLFTSEIFKSSLWVTIKYMLINLPLQIPVSYVLAYLLYKKIGPFRFFRFVFFLPCVLLSVVVGYTLNILFTPWFGIGAVLKGLGIKYVNPLAEPRLAIYGVIFGDYWQWLGIKIVLFYAGFQDLPVEILEAATIDGASELQKFFRIVIPLSWHTVTTVTALLLMGSLRVFDLVFIMTGGGPNHATETLSIHLFNLAFDQMDFGSGSAVAVILFLLSLTLTIVLRRVMQRFFN
ncbi:MAG: raffinose/stachyose/melibiose transport system permease protein [Candidatus Atribacteria bacterium]|nr:raffinose/stachyose/melibiose transport system permease protein [Candidatus Atribacteria bacterium]